MIKDDHMERCAIFDGVSWRFKGEGIGVRN